MGSQPPEVYIKIYSSLSNDFYSEKPGDRSCMLNLYGFSNPQQARLTTAKGSQDSEIINSYPANFNSNKSISMPTSTASYASRGFNLLSSSLASSTSSLIPSSHGSISSSSGMLASSSSLAVDPSIFFADLTNKLRDGVVNSFKYRYSLYLPFYIRTFFGICIFV